MKIIKVDVCFVCPYKRLDLRDNKYLCEITKKKIEKIYDNPPIWCPLIDEDD